MNARVSLPMARSYERPDVCGACGGNCCKSMPGAAMPSDFGSSAEEIAANLSDAFATGKWAIDWWEGDPRDDGGDDLDRAYFIRPATTGGRGLFDPSWGGRCVFLGDAGCEIFERRPSGCRGLEPSPPDCKVQHSGKQDAAIAWLPLHNEILESARRP